MRYSRIQIFSDNSQPPHKPSIIILYLQDEAQLLLSIKNKAFLICLLSLVLDGPHRTNFSFLKILCGSCLCSYLQLPMLLCFSAEMPSLITFVWQSIIHSSGNSSNIISFFELISILCLLPPSSVQS